MPAYAGNFLQVRCQSLKLELRHCLNAFRASTLLHVLPAFKDANALNIRVELAARRTHREAALVAKLRLLSANFTDRHLIASALTSTYKPAGDATIALLQKQGRTPACAFQTYFPEVSL